MKSKSFKSFALSSSLVLVSAGSLHAVSYFDSASNVAYSSGWTTGSNGGSGFGTWTITANSGTSGFAGSLIGDPTSAGITGMSTTSFVLYANPSGSEAFANADRSFANPLGVGESFSFQWGIHFDSGASGNKGFNLYSGGTGGAQLININNGGNSDITINGTNVGFGYGKNAMTWTFKLTSATNLQVDATDRDGNGAYSGNFAISGTSAPDAFRFYASNMQSGDAAQPYFNNLSIVPEPSSLSLLALSGLALLRRRRA